MMKYCENCNCKETGTPPCASGAALSDAEEQAILCCINDYDNEPAVEPNTRILAGLRSILSRASSSQANGWTRACDQALVCANLGIANADDTFEVAQDKLRQLIEWEIAVAIDPKVNGGYVLTKESK